MLTPHFSEGELGYRADLPIAIRTNLRLTAQLLEALRTATGGGPFYDVSAYRDPVENFGAGGVKDSGHLIGAASDFKPLLGLYRFTQRLLALEAAGEAPAYGELIVYPVTTGHVHVTLPGVGGRREKLVNLGPGQYVPLTPERLATLPGSALGGAAAALFAFLLLAFVLSKGVPDGG